MRGWLLRILTNEFKDELRKKRRRGLHVELVEGDLPASEADEPSPWEEISTDDVREAADQLPPHLRDTYCKFAIEGFDYETIAALLHVSKNAVAGQIYRARKKLREFLIGSAPGRKRGKGSR